MATGITKGEKNGNESLTVDMVTEEPFDLPTGNELLTFSYENKIELDDLISLDSRPIIKIDGESPSNERESKFDNSLLWTDNLFGLKSLLDEYSDKITLIYLDPPYGTGMEFHSRNLEHAYKDKYDDVTYIEFLRRRLLLMRELLTDDGAIYVHIGHQMVFHLKIIMDEIFGRQNFRNLITRKKCSSKNYTKNQYPNLNDFILYYTKTKQSKWNKPGIPASKAWIEKEYTRSDNRGRYKLVPIHAPGKRNGETGKEWKGMKPPLGKHWQMIPSKLDQLDKNGEIHWSRNGNPRRKVYLPKNKELPLTDYWSLYRDAHHQSIKITGYPTEKNIDMLRMIVLANTEQGDLVLDPFCGSGTTLQAANDLGRRWIGIDQSTTAIKACLSRFRDGTRAMGDYVKKDEKKNLDLFGSEYSDPQLTGKNVDYSLFIDEEFYRKNQDMVRALVET